MNDWVRTITSRVEPLKDPIYGHRYRCALTLKDGTFLPCAVIQSKERVVEFAKRRIKEEMRGRWHFGGEDSYTQIVATFVANENRIAEYNVASSDVSKYAIPLALLAQIRGETTMGWTGWVFRMRDGQLFSYGSSFHTEFLQLPDGYDFSDVIEVINHSFVDSRGNVVGLRDGGVLAAQYRPATVLRERVFFACLVDGV